jgi:hypothetical protein
MTGGSYRWQDSLSHERAVKILNDWGSKGFFRNKKFGSSLNLQAIEETLCFRLCCNTQYEHRSVETITEPYYGGKIDDYGTPPDIWDIEVDKPSGRFVKEIIREKIPHTDSVSICSNCGGMCRVDCSSCSGSGDQRCSCQSGTISCSCNGGKVTEIVWETEYDFEGRSQTVSKTVYRTCSYCGGSGYTTCTGCSGRGYVTCYSCSGSGQVDCDACERQGRVIRYDLLKVHFDFQSKSQIIGAIQVPEEKLSKVSGNGVLEKWDSEITDLSELEDRRLAEHTFEFLTDFNERDLALLYQELVIDKIPVFTVTYKKSLNGKLKTLWIYGTENEVYFEGQWDAPKLGGFGVVLGGLSAVGLVGLLAATVMQNISDDSYSPSTESLSSAIALCNEVDDRRIALNISKNTYSAKVDRIFRQENPEFKGGIDKTNEDHAPYLKAWCTIGSNWLNEQESQSEEVAKEPQNEGEPTKPKQNACSSISNYNLYERRIALNISYSTYVSKVDARFKEHNPEITEPINPSNDSHAELLKEWCKFADQYLTEQEELASSDKSNKSEEDPQEGSCSMIASYKIDEKTGELVDTSPCKDY